MQLLLRYDAILQFFLIRAVVLKIFFYNNNHCNIIRFVLLCQKNGLNKSN